MNLRKNLPIKLVVSCDMLKPVTNLICCLILAATTFHAEEKITVNPIKLMHEDLEVNSFPSLESAQKAGCDILNLNRFRNTKSCVLKWFKGRTLNIQIFDTSSDGSYKLTKHIKLTSWYNRAEVHYHPYDWTSSRFFFPASNDPKNRPVKSNMIELKFEGNSGPGILQMLSMLIMWNGNDYVPVLLETTAFRKNENAFRGKLSQTLKLHPKLNQVEAKASLTEKVTSTATTYTLQSSWLEKLKCNEQSFCFYDKNHEVNAMKGSKMRAAIAANRLLFIKNRPKLTSGKIFQDQNKDLLQSHFKIY